MRLIVALVLAGALVAAAPAASMPTTATADVAAKPRKCKKQQVRVKINGRRVCRPARKALPKPKKGDPRLVLARSALGADFSALRNRRGRKVPSLPKLIRRLGPRAPSLLTRVTARALARVDAPAATASTARAAAGCGGAPQQSDSFRSNGGDGTSAQVTATSGPDGLGIGIELSGREFTVKVDLDFGCAPEGVQAPSCPTAVGRLQGEIRYKLRASVQVSRGGEDVWSQALDVTRKTELDGWTDVDAKLDRLDVEDVETSTFRLGGSTRGFPPISIRSRVVRRTQVDMRSGAYVPDRSDINVTVSTAGLGGPDRAELEDDLAERSRAKADEQFRVIVDKAITSYRGREEAWQQPKACAKLKFSPEPGRRTVRRGEAGSFTATMIANQDGGASELDAKLTSPVNATFSPTRAGGQSARFDYTVTTAPADRIRVKVRATSKAGVDEETWEQPIEPPFEINKIAGNFSGLHTMSVGQRTARVSWTGGATFVRAPQGVPGAVGNYTLTAGHATFTYSGGTITAHAACDMSGHASVDLFQDAGGSIGVTPVGSDPFAAGPQNYGGLVSLGPDPKVTLTMSNCVPGAESENGKTYEYPVGVVPFDTGSGQTRQSPDGIHYDGSHSVSQGGIATEWTWVLLGSK
jgi:hypothetical protein